MSFASAQPDTAGSEEFAARVRDRNPFIDNRINGPAAGDVDVEALNQVAFARLTALAREACDQRRGLGAVLWGEAGIGKSHLLSRLARWARGEGGACLVYLHNLQASPANLPRALLRAVGGELTARDGRWYTSCPLYGLMREALCRAVGADSGRYSWGRVERAFHDLLAAHAAQGPADAAIADRTIPEVLFRFFQSAERAARGKEDGNTAALAVRWLSGDALDAEQARQLGLPPSRGRDEPVALEDNQRIKQALVTLSRILSCLGRPFVLCFDQVDNLENEQASALARFLEALIDSAPNLLVVTAGIQASLLGWRRDGVIQESSWDRLAQFQVPLQRLSSAEARQVIEKRLQRFLEPFEELSPARQLVYEDSLFPLGSAWYAALTAGRIDVRPREVVNAARECWQREQQILGAGDGTSWLANWRQRQGDIDPLPPDPTRDHLDAAIDRAIDEEITRYRKNATETPPDRDSITESVAQLLEQCRELGLAPAGFAAERVQKLKYGPQTAYDLMTRHLVEGKEVHTGLVLAPGVNPRGMVHVLARLVEDSSPPPRILLATDDYGLDLGNKGDEHLQTLRQRPGCELKVLKLPRAEFASLEALHAVWNLARNYQLDVTPPAGTARPIQPQEVIESHHRQGRYLACAVLKEAMKPPPPAPEAEVVVEVGSAGAAETPVTMIANEDDIFLDEASGQD